MRTRAQSSYKVFSILRVLGLRTLNTQQSYELQEAVESFKPTATKYRRNLKRQGHTSERTSGILQ